MRRAALPSLWVARTLPGGADAGPIGELERAIAELRQEARQAWKRHGLTTEQSRDVVDILTEASNRIREVVRRR